MRPVAVFTKVVSDNLLVLSSGVINPLTMRRRRVSILGTEESGDETVKP